MTQLWLELSIVSFVHLTLLENNLFIFQCKTFTNGHIFFCFYGGLHFKCTLIAALWTILCDDFHVFLQTENLAFCTFPLHFYWHIYRGLNSIFSKWRKTEEGSRNCTSITVTCVISTSWGCCPNNDYHVTILTYVSCDDKQTIQCMSAWCVSIHMHTNNNMIQHRQK